MAILEILLIRITEKETAPGGKNGITFSRTGRDVCKYFAKVIFKDGVRLGKIPVSTEIKNLPLQETIKS